MRITPQDVGRKFYATDFLKYVVRGFDGADVIIARDDLKDATDNRFRQIGYDLLLRSGGEYNEINFRFGAWADEPATDQVADQVRPKDLRDEVAISFAEHIVNTTTDALYFPDIWRLAYEFADAMMKARGK